MTEAEDGISVGLLQEEDCDHATAVWLPNFSGPQKIFFLRIIKSWRFFAFCGVTHLFISWAFSVPFETFPMLLTFFLSISIHVCFVCFFLFIICRPKDQFHLYSYWSQPHRRFIVAKDESHGHRVIGTVAIERNTKDPSKTELFRFRVIPEYQRRGVGVRLNNEAERLAKEEFGCRTMMLETVPEHETGIAFYVRNGYQLVKAFSLKNMYLEQNIVVIHVYEKELH